MHLLIDTNVAIHLRDKHPAVRALIEEAGEPVLSAISVVELEAGAADDRSGNQSRRPLLDRLLERIPILPFTAAEAAEYGRIVSQLGFARRRVLDRMIAAQAIVAGLPLATINAGDFADISNLELRIWSI